MGWTDRIRQAFNFGKESTKDLFVELKPDREIAGICISDEAGHHRDAFHAFVRDSVRRALHNGHVPDNTLVCRRFITDRDAAGIHKDKKRVSELLADYDGADSIYSVPLRKAAYLYRNNKEINLYNLTGLNDHPGYRQYRAYEEAMEKRAAGRAVKMRLTITRRGECARVFNNSLDGPDLLRTYLQDIADNFFLNPMKNTSELSIYLLETASSRLQGFPINRDIPLTAPGMEILRKYSPSEVFDLRPKGENLLRLAKACSLKLNRHNCDILTLLDIAEKGYAHLDIPFSFRKEFAGIEKTLNKASMYNNSNRSMNDASGMREQAGESAGQLARKLLAAHGIRIWEETPKKTAETAIKAGDGKKKGARTGNKINRGIRIKLK